MKVRLGDVCEKGSSNIMQKEVAEHTGPYPIYGASGQIGNVDFYHQDKPYVAVVKDGAGIGRTMLLPANSSIIGTLQYLLPKKGVSPEYLYYVVRYMRLEKYFSGATIPHIYFRDYKNEEFSLATEAEQDEIVGALNRVSSIINMRQKQLAELDELVKSRFVEIFGDPEKNPKGWRVLPMSGICSVGSSKRIYQSEQTSDGIPFWRISDLTDVIFTGTVSPNLYIPEDRYEELKEQGQVPAPGDILLTSRGTLGQCYVVKKGDKFYFQDGMISWLSKYTNDVTPLYILWLFAMSGFRKQIDAMQTGSTVAYLSIAMIKQLKIMLPPLELQNRFVSFVQHVEKTKTGIIHGLERLETLKRALMQRYFG